MILLRENNLRKENGEKIYFPTGNTVFGKRISRPLNPEAKVYLLKIPPAFPIKIACHAYELLVKVQPAELGGSPYVARQRGKG